ncbi:MAG TPA: AMP-binding protein [Methylococcus sp.]|nr:AMP-binding protein [Methylococcus sp.]
MTEFAVLTHSSWDAIVARRRSGAITVRRFLEDVAGLAAWLPERLYLLNDCSDRYRFAVGFLAALLRRQVNLLPPTLTPETVRRLANRFPGVYCLADDPATALDLPTYFFPERFAKAFPVDRVPVIESDRMAAYALTSGSTGVPVPHPKTWGALVRSARAERDRLGIGADCGIVGTVPAQHMYGLESTVLLPLQSGASFWAGRPFFPADVCTALEGIADARILFTTPYHLRALLESAGRFPRLGLLVSATAPLSERLALLAEQRFRAPLVEIYGCTEAGQLATRRPTLGAEWTVFAGIEIAEDRKGVWVQGSHVEQRVYLQDEVDLQSPRTFLLRGRSSDMINIAGKRTSLAYLNHQINSIPGVLDAVFYLPPERGGEVVTRLVAFVVAPGLTSAEIMLALRERVDPVFLPRPLHLVERLPRNSTGKLTRDAMEGLIEQVQDGIVLPALS